jgi:type I restriction enzyme S subunit
VNYTERAVRTGPYPYYGANGQVGTIDEYIFDEELVLVAEDGGFFLDPLRPIAYRVSGKCWVNNHAHVLRAREGLDPDWLCYAIAFQDISLFVKGATRPKLNQKELREIPVPMPTAAEQRRIIGRIRECTERIDEMAKLRREMVNDASALASSFVTEQAQLLRERYPVSSIEHIVRGRHDAMASGPFGSQLKHSEFVTDGHLVIGISNVQRHRFDSTRRWMVSEETLRRLERFRVQPHDLLITVMGTVGRCCVVPEDVGTAVTSKHVYRIRLPRDVVSPLYVSALVNFDRETIGRLHGRAIGGVMPGLNSTKLKELTIPVPTMSVQESLVESVEEFTRIEEVAIHAATEPEKLLRQAVLRKAFLGKL